MKEQLILFETAKLAKKKWFDWECRYIFDEEGIIDKLADRIGLEFTQNSRCAKNHFAVPTQSLLQDWLRKKYNCIVEPIFLKEAKDNYISFIVTVDYYGKNFKIPQKEEEDFRSPKRHSIYEEALEEGLYEALKLIK